MNKNAGLTFEEIMAEETTKVSLVIGEQELPGEFVLGISLSSVINEEGEEGWETRLAFEGTVSPTHVVAMIETLVVARNKLVDRLLALTIEPLDH